MGRKEGGAGAYQLAKLDVDANAVRSVPFKTNGTCGSLKADIDRLDPSLSGVAVVVAMVGRKREGDG